MRNILIINYGNTNECLISTSLLKRFKNDSVSILVANTDAAAPFRYNPSVKNIYLKNKLPNNFSDIKFDLLINLHPSFDKNNLKISYDKAVGFNFSDDSFKYEKVLYYDQETERNIFQIYYSLAGLKWAGEGFELHYYPQNRSKANRVGLAMSNIKLKDFVDSNLSLKDLRLWNIPYRKNFFKKVDEINRCNTIITDDLYSLNIALALRKEIYFLETIKFNFKLEFFGKGSVFRVPKHLI